MAHDHYMPAQTARPPLRIPRSKTAAMLRLQQLSRDHQWWTRGVVSAARLPSLVSKFDTQFGVLDPSSTRTRKRGGGVPTAYMVVYRQPDTDRWLWWLLVAGHGRDIERLTARYNEVLHRLRREDTPLLWTEEYVLRTGPRGSMTWWLQRRRANDMEGELRYLASAHGRPKERIDDLCRAVTRARARPLFAGVRRQVMTALQKGKRRWQKTHGTEPWPADDSQLPWMGRSLKIYDEPPAVVVPDTK